MGGDSKVTSTGAGAALRSLRCLCRGPYSQPWCLTQGELAYSATASFHLTITFSSLCHLWLQLILCKCNQEDWQSQPNSPPGPRRRSAAGRACTVPWGLSASCSVIKKRFLCCPNMTLRVVKKSLQLTKIPPRGNLTERCASARQHT